MPKEDSVPLSIATLESNTSVAPLNTTSVAPPNTTTVARPVIMAGTKEKVPKFDGDGTADPIEHYKTCSTIWTANGVTDTNEWVRLFLATLRGVAIDWFADGSPKITILGSN